MNWKRHFFTPDQVDDQVDQFSLPAPQAIVQRQAQEPEQQDEQDVHASEQADSRQDVSTQLVQELQAYYQSERQQNQDFLEHAWWRIVAHQPASHVTTQANKAAPSSPLLRFSPERMKLMQDQNSRGKRFARSVSTLAASLVAVVLVGALVAVLLLSHRTPQSSTLGSGRTPTPVTTPTATTTTAPLPGNVGSVIHTQKSPTGMRSYKLAWSPDSSRIATLSDDTNGANVQLQIWDATTGSGLLSVPFTTSFDDISWSPTGKYLALDNLQEVVIVNAQTGSVVNTLTNDAFSKNFGGQSVPVTGTGMAPLASFMPDGGGYGSYSSVWSPDGTTLAVSVSYYTSTKVEFLDPLTGAVKATLSAPYGALMGLAYSSDGQYLVASNTHLVVWRLSSKAIVYQQNLNGSNDAVWQPGTHNLAISLMSSDSVQLWNIDTHKLVNTYAGISIVSWSPDGKELAGLSSPQPSQNTVSSPPQVPIIDAASGKTVFTYKSSASSIFGVNWSPDGHYIATVEFDASNSGVISVWVA